MTDRTLTLAIIGGGISGPALADRHDATRSKASCRNPSTGDDACPRCSYGAEYGPKRAPGEISDEGRRTGKPFICLTQEPRSRGDAQTRLIGTAPLPKS